MKKPTISRVIEISISNFEDVVYARRHVGEVMKEMDFPLIDQTRVVTAVSELSRNIVVHAGQGKMTIKPATKTGAVGVTCIFEDQGPGIQDIPSALTDGFSTVNSLGLGLPGAKRLCDEFQISSTVGKGTRVSITEWL